VIRKKQPLKPITIMKNLRKLSKGELKTIQGGIQSCEPWMTICPCRPGFHRCEPKGACIPATTMC